MCIRDRFSREGLQRLCGEVERLPAAARTACTTAFAQRPERYAATIDAVIAFVQGRDSTLAHRIASRNWLPEGCLLYTSRCV